MEKKDRPIGSRNPLCIIFGHPLKCACILELVVLTHGMTIIAATNAAST